MPDYECSKIFREQEHAPHRVALASIRQHRGPTAPAILPALIPGGSKYGYALRCFYGPFVADRRAPSPHRKTARPVQTSSVDRSKTPPNGMFTHRLQNLIFWLQVGGHDQQRRTILALFP